MSIQQQIRNVAYMIRQRLMVRLPQNVDQQTASATLAAPSDFHVAPFDLQLISAARSVAASGDHRIILPTDSTKLEKKIKDIKIGFFGD